MIRSLIPFSELTRGVSIPQFEVAKRPMLIHGKQLAVGARLPLEVFNKVRLRQLYEQRSITPVVPPKGSRQEASARHHPPRPVQAPKAKATVPASAPVTVVSTIPGVTSSVPVADTPKPAKPAAPSRGYQPARGGNRRR